MRKRFVRRKRYMFFALGAAVGSACGLVLGSLLTFWLGEETVRVVQRGVRRVSGRHQGPSLDLLTQ